MRPITPKPRGMALIMAMIVIVLITMLVAGAISFTGTELAAAEVQTQEASMSACIQAARNLFLSRLKRVMKDEQVTEGTATVSYLPINFNEDLRNIEDPSRSTVLRTGHMGGLAGLSARRVEAMMDQMRAQGDDTDRGKRNSTAAFYTVTAVCRDTSIAGGPEREIEFMVRVGI